MKNDSDAGNGFADRLITLVGIAMLLLTVVTVVAAPWIVDIYRTPKTTETEYALAVTFARYCLPQIFFYGVYTMLSQVLNARGKFAAPMFAPIVNNVVSVIAFLGFAWVWGTAPATNGQLTTLQLAVLGLGATLGVAAQAVVLIPSVLRAGYRWRPRFDWRGVGLGHAGTLAFWTIGLVLVNQVAYVFIVRLLNNGSGLAAYQNAHIVFILPHSIITVSLVTALLPRMSRAAAAHKWSELAEYVAGGSRTAAAAICPRPPPSSCSARCWQLCCSATAPPPRATCSSRVADQRAGRRAAAVHPLLHGVARLVCPRSQPHGVLGHGVLNILNVAFAFAAFDWITDHGYDSTRAVQGIAGGYVVAYWITAVIAWRILSRRSVDSRPAEPRARSCGC